jgi:hypothetical protein
VFPYSPRKVLHSTVLQQNPRHCTGCHRQAFNLLTSAADHMVDEHGDEVAVRQAKLKQDRKERASTSRGRGRRRPNQTLPPTLTSKMRAQ